LSENGGRAKILVADDAPDVADRLVDMLSELEHAEVVGPARNGAEALDLYGDHRPHAAIIDLEMPVLSGLDVLRAIRQRDRASMVIILTNERAEEIRNRCLEMGANHYLRKSTEFEKAVDLFADFIKQGFQEKTV